MAANAPASFDHKDLRLAVDMIDVGRDGLSLEELKKGSAELVELLRDNLRAAAADIKTEIDTGKKPNPEKVASLRSTLDRLSVLNSLKSNQEEEIRTLHGQRIRELLNVYVEVKSNLDKLNAAIVAGSVAAAPATTVAVSDAPSAPKAAPAATVVVSSVPEASPTATVVASSAPAKVEKKEKLPSSFVAKREFLLGDDAAFVDKDGKRTSIFSQEQLRFLLSQPQVAANEAALDALVERLTGSKLDLSDAVGSAAVRAQFLRNLERRVTSLTGLYENTVGKKIGNTGEGTGGLLHVLTGNEKKLVADIFDAAAKLEERKEGKGFAVTLEEIGNTLKGVGLGMLLGPVYLDWRSRNGIADAEIREGKKSSPLSWRTSDSERNLEFRVAPAIRLFGLALGVSVEANANLNDREAAIVGKVKSAAASYDSLIDPKTGLMDASKAPAEYAADADEFNRNVRAMLTGDAARDAKAAKSVRDAYLYELTDRLVRDDLGLEFKGVGVGAVLLFGILPVKGFVKANVQHLSADIRAGNSANGVSELDKLSLGAAKLAERGILLTKTPEGKYRYAIDEKRGYKVDNRSGSKLDAGVLESDKPLYFRHLVVASDAMKKGEVPTETLIVSAEPFVVGASAEEASQAPRETVYVVETDDALRNEVVNAMRGITSVHIREKFTGIYTLQGAIAKAYASGDFESAFELLKRVRVDGKRPLKALAETYSNAPAATKRAILETVVQETAGDWRVRNFDAIKRDKAAFADFVRRTGYRGTQEALTLAEIASAWNLGATFDRNLVAKSAIAPSESKAAMEAVAGARARFTEPVRALDGIETHSREIKNAIGFVNFHQVAYAADGKAYKRFQDVVPVAGTVKTLDVEPTDFENAAIRRELVKKIPTFVLESLRQTINAQAKSVGAPEVATTEEVRGLLLENGAKDGKRPDVQLTSKLSYTRFAKCLNDTYLIRDIRLCVTGPNGRSQCAPEIPEVATDLLAPTGARTNSVTDVGIGASFNLGPTTKGDGGGSNPSPGGTTVPGVNPGGGTVTPPSTPPSGF